MRERVAGGYRVRRGRDHRGHRRERSRLQNHHDLGEVG